MKKVILEFVAKLGIMGIIAFVLGFFDAFCEVKLGWDISRFMYFTLGYISCLLFNWRWFIYAERKKEK